MTTPDLLGPELLLIFSVAGTVSTAHNHFCLAEKEESVWSSELDCPFHDIFVAAVVSEKVFFQLPQ